MYKAIMFVLVVACVALYSYIAGTMTPMLMSTNNDAVYAVCNQSRLEHSGDMEKACGIAQDSSDTEFTCEYNNNNPSTICRVENKEN